MTPVGILVALGSIMISMIMDHGKPTALINIPRCSPSSAAPIGVSIAGVSR